MEQKDFRKTAALYGGDVDRVHITRNSLVLLKWGNFARDLDIWMA
jgi:hypothetical protein